MVNNMREIITVTKAYTFDELTPEQKEKAIENLYDINVYYDWCEFTYEDAENIGLTITSFYLDYNTIEGKFNLYPLDICRAIFKEHGKDTPTYRLAMAYVKERENLIAGQCQHQADCWTWPGEKDWDYLQEQPWDIDYEDLDNEFHHSLKEEYLSMLRQEYEYLTSKEAIIETIKANEYEFNEEGELI